MSTLKSETLRTSDSTHSLRSRRSVYLERAVTGKNPVRHRIPARSVEALAQSEDSSRHSLGEGGSLIAKPTASPTINQNSKSQPALPPAETISTVEEWRPQPRKRNQIGQLVEVGDSGDGADELSVSFPEPNRIIFYGPSYFASWESVISRRFAELSLGIREVRELEIDTINKTATLSLVDNGKKVLRKIVEVYRGNRRPDLTVAYSPKLVRVVPRKVPRVRLFRYGKTEAIVLTPSGDDADVGQLELNSRGAVVFFHD